MREILFKAKHITIDKWYEGYYVKMERLHYICVIEEGFENGYRLVEIDPSTLCQYTGLTDKNGTKIWENDLVHIDAYNYIEPEDSCFGVVQYSIAYSSFCLDDGENSWIPMYECTGSYTTIYHVVGNVFDNPELMEGNHEV